MQYDYVATILYMRDINYAWPIIWPLLFRSIFLSNQVFPERFFFFLVWKLNGVRRLNWEVVFRLLQIWKLMFQMCEHMAHQCNKNKKNIYIYNFLWMKTLCEHLSWEIKRKHYRYFLINCCLFRVHRSLLELFVSNYKFFYKSSYYWKSKPSLTHSEWMGR